jgi:hypothetical protein
MTEPIECAAKSCHCQLNRADAISANGQLYCSQRCVDGRGCDHAGCNCGAYPTEEPRAEQHRGSH